MQCYHSIALEFRRLNTGIPRTNINIRCAIDEKHLRGNYSKNRKREKKIHYTLIAVNTDNNVNAELSDDKDNTQTITNNNDNDDDSIMFNIDSNSIIKKSLPNLNNNKLQGTGRQEFEQPLSHRELSPMANNWFQTIWRI